MPRLRDKPHAVEPLNLTPIPCEGTDAMEGDHDHGSSSSTGFTEYFPHPYAAELRALRPQPWQLEVPAESELVKPQASPTYIHGSC